MFVPKEDAERLLRDQLGELVDSLRKQNKFLGDLKNGDDWAFVIKAQALIEGAVTQAVLSHIGDRRLLRIVEAMPLLGDEVSKLALVKDLEIMTSDQRRFVRVMASLRNRLAHRTEHANFTFEGHIESLNRDKRNEWKAAIPWFADNGESRQTWAIIAIKAPKAVVYLSTFMLVGLLSANGSEKEIMRKIDELAVNTTENLTSPVLRDTGA